MNNNKFFDENMNAVFTKVEDYIKHENLLGAPVSVQNKTLVPVVSVTLGYGSGNHSTKMNQNTTDSSPALGLGARVCTDAIMVMDNDSVSMLPVSQKNNMDKIINKIPEMVTNLKQKYGTKQPTSWISKYSCLSSNINSCFSGNINKDISSL